MTLSFTTRRAHESDLAAISELHERTLGPGRFARSAYRVREGTAGVSRFCRVALLDRRIVAALRMTEITIGGTDGALMLGPLAVDPEFTGQGCGRRLIAELLDDARAAGIKLVVLVGDPPYYGRFGFQHVPMGQILLPGPVNPLRLLAVELKPGALAEYRGPVHAVR